MGSIFSFIFSIFKSKVFWYIVVAIIVIIILKRNWYKISRYFQSSDINLENGEGKLTAARKQQLEYIATQLFDSIEGSHDDEAYDAALNLTDQELKYVSQYYRKYITQGEWLYTQIDDEWFSTGNDRDVRLMRRLATIGEKG